MIKDSIDNIVDLLIFDEGIKKRCYQCTKDKWTVGVGRNLEANPITDKEWKFLLDNDCLDVEINEQGSMFLLGEDIRKINLELNRYSFFKSLDEVRQAVLINMAYAMGVDGVLRFQNMIAQIKISNWQTAQQELEDSRFHRNLVMLKSKRSKRLSEMMLTGEWPNVD